jgi:alkylated DNA nucleotide flippase Atl1
MTNSKLIYKIICTVPFGRVISYGQISTILLDCHQVFLRAQVVGWIMNAMKHKFADMPWQRVVAKNGQLVTYKLGYAGVKQKELLELEEVEIIDNFVDMLKFSLSDLELKNLYEVIK